MTLVPSFLPGLAVAVSAVAAFLILRLDGQPNVREGVTFTAAAIKLWIVMTLVPGALAGSPLQTTVVEMLPGVALEFRADALGTIFALLASSLWLLTSVFSVGYMRGLEEHAQTRYYASFALSLSATIGVAFAGNLLTLYLFYEILTLATYPLVIHKEDAEAIAAARKYLAYTLGSSVTILIASAAIYALTGSLELKPGGILTLDTAQPWTLDVLFVLLIIGFAVKAAIMPLHGWLPSAMVAPTPVSALLHAVAVVKSGVFGCVRVIGFVFGTALLRELGIATVLAYFAAATILLASLLALAQDSLKKRLAYSTVSQLSYIVLGAAMLNPTGITGSVLHLAYHGMLKITLFFCAGAIYVTTGCDRVSQLSGIGRRMPWTMAAFALAALGLAGVPPLNGFFSKWYLCIGTLEAHHGGLTLVLVLSGLLNLAYFFPIVYAAFFRSSERFTEMDEASPALLVPLLITAGASLAVGVWPNLASTLWALAEQVARGV